MLNPKDAHGPDGIPSWVLKENADLLAFPIKEILNSSYQDCRIPQSWKNANVIPISKKKPLKDINDHLRPISLTPVLSKAQYRIFFVLISFISLQILLISPSVLLALETMLSMCFDQDKSLDIITPRSLMYGICSSTLSLME